MGIESIASQHAAPKNTGPTCHPSPVSISKQCAVEQRQKEDTTLQAQVVFHYHKQLRQRQVVAAWQVLVRFAML